VKIQLRGQLSIDRHGGDPLSLQIVRQLQQAIESGRLAGGVVLPSSRALARALGVSRNTVLAADDELKARGLIRGRRGSGMCAAPSPVSRGFDVRRVMREAQYPSRTMAIQDPDGNPITVLW
jgi:GntR family transcriptional regulator/MocR family aminotransferase